jgi:hypothetical protein
VFSRHNVCLLYVDRSLLRLKVEKNFLSEEGENRTQKPNGRITGIVYDEELPLLQFEV